MSYNMTGYNIYDHRQLNYSKTSHCYPIFGNQSQSINKVPTRFDVYIKGNRNDFFATRGADIAIVTGFGMDLLVIYY
jgi:hypothetical protein